MGWQRKLKLCIKRLNLEDWLLNQLLIIEPLIWTEEIIDQCYWLCTNLLYKTLPTHTHLKTFYQPSVFFLLFFKPFKCTDLTMYNRPTNAFKTPGNEFLAVLYETVVNNLRKVKLRLMNVPRISCWYFYATSLWAV